MALLMFLLSVVAAGLCEGGREICDDGQYLIWKDMAFNDPSRCQQDHFQTTTYYDPAGVSECSDQLLEPVLRCMKDNISYSEQPPSSGAYRPVAPKYGEYNYLPAQRWLHVLQLGGVAFLYHPCAPLDQLIYLRDVATACLWKHVITPYPLLPQEQPFALVSWGCVYRMSWVSVPEAKLWLKEHALQTEQHMVSSYGAYNQGLLVEANTNITHDIVCPDSAPLQGTLPTANTVPSSATANKTLCRNSTTQCHQNVIVLQSHVTVVLLLVFAVLVVAAAVVILSGKICSRLRNGNHTASRYKSVSKFFPFSYGKVEEGVAMPELGVPKTRAAEREVLLNYSDEDEL